MTRGYRILSVCGAAMIATVATHTIAARDGATGEWRYWGADERSTFARFGEGAQHVGAPADLPLGRSCGLVDQISR